MLFFSSGAKGSCELLLALFSRLKGLSKDRAVALPSRALVGVLPPLKALAVVTENPKPTMPPPR